jgi:hypothetical protein
MLAKLPAGFQRRSQPLDLVYLVLLALTAFINLIASQELDGAAVPRFDPHPTLAVNLTNFRYLWHVLSRSRN